MNSIQRIKAVFFDIDGTFFDHNTKTIPHSNIQSALLLQQKGYKVALASARPLASIKKLPVFKDIQWDGIVCAGGQQVYNEKFDLVFQDSFTKEELNDIFSIAKKEQITVYAYGDNDFFTQDSPFINKFKKQFNLDVNDIHPYQGEEIYLITLIMQENFRYEPYFKHMPRVRIQYAGTLNTDLFPCTVTKPSGIHQLMKYWQFPISAYLAFGDSGGDIEMLQDAEIGVAMGNGTDECKKAANFICGDSDKDGIYTFLKETKIL